MHSTHRSPDVTVRNRRSFLVYRALQQVLLNPFIDDVSHFLNFLGCHVGRMRKSKRSGLKTHYSQIKTRGPAPRRIPESAGSLSFFSRRAAKDCSQGQQPGDSPWLESGLSRELMSRGAAKNLSPLRGSLAGHTVTTASGRGYILTPLRGWDNKGPLALDSYSASNENFVVVMPLSRGAAQHRRGPVGTP